MKKLAQLIKTGKTIFSTKELVVIWNADQNTVKTTTHRMVKDGSLIRLQGGLFAIGKINSFELGCKLMPKSYVSLFTVLKEAGILFQEFQQIYLIGERPKTATVGGLTFEYHTITKLVSFPDGIEFHENYSIATIERAILEVFQLFDTDYSDFKISQFNQEKFIKLSKFFNKKTQKKAKEFLKYFNL